MNSCRRDPFIWQTSSCHQILLHSSQAANPQYRIFILCLSPGKVIRLVVHQEHISDGLQYGEGWIHAAPRSARDDAELA